MAEVGSTEPLTPEAASGWVDAYERAWRHPTVEALTGLFADDVEYLTEPYAEPVVGLDALGRFWAEETAPGEEFAMTSEVVACSGRTAVVRVEVRYTSPLQREYRDLWVVTIGLDGRATRFEEWPFWPTHGRSAAHPPAVVLDAGAVEAAPWREWVRSGSLSGGVYRVPAGGVDGQSPHEEDEVYVVTTGRAELDVDGARTAVHPGSVAYVPARVPHRFVDVAEDLEVVVVFAPPESG